MNVDGGYIPNCETDGSYKIQQCFMGEGCWCVDVNTGVEVPNTRVPEAGDINCKGMYQHGLLFMGDGQFSIGGMRNETENFAGMRYESMKFLAEWRMA